PTLISTLSLHDALPICQGATPLAHRLLHRPVGRRERRAPPGPRARAALPPPAPHRLAEGPPPSGAGRRPPHRPDLGLRAPRRGPDRKSTRLNSSHVKIS